MVWPAMTRIWPDPNAASRRHSPRKGEGFAQTGIRAHGSATHLPLDAAAPPWPLGAKPLSALERMRSGRAVFASRERLRHEYP